jgi:tetratricopeptide (TPR) repeat protein
MLRGALPLSEKLLSEMAKLRDDSSRNHFLSRRARLRCAAAVQQLNEASRAKLRVDPREALALAESAVAIAEKLRNKDALGRSLRAKANALYNSGDNATALEFHARALEIFRATRNTEEQGRTLNASIQPYILVGQYDRALAAAEAARAIFRAAGDSRRLGHIEINVGNIYHRQDRFEEGLACYERGYEILAPLRDAEGLAIAMYNMAVCLITLNDFPRALASYQRAREMFVSYGMTLLVTQSDYNIAYLYYLRGEYSQAIRMLRAARLESEKNGDQHVLALCFLDLSEIYLELNMSGEAREIAREGYLRFEKLAMGYEQAKCLANEAMANGQLGKALAALELFGQAREMLAREQNSVWPWLIDLYQAVVLLEEDRLFESRRLCQRSAEFFETSVLHGKAALCHLLLARIAMRTNDLALAREECAAARDRVAGLESPSLRLQAHFLMGQIDQAAGDTAKAYGSYQAARAELETLRSSLRGEELKISFMKNRLEIYESLVDLCLRGVGKHGAGRENTEEAFTYMELAKSRSLADLLLSPGASMAPSGEGQSGLVRRIREMREELNWYYRRIEREQLSSEAPSAARIEKLQTEALARENNLVRVLHELRSTEAGSDCAAVDGMPSLESIRETLPCNAALVEYFEVKGQFIAAVLTRESLRIVPLTPVSRAVNLVRLLRFQLAKFSLGSGYVRTFEDALLRASRTHLDDLYRELIAPLREQLSDAAHLIIVPHGVLHSLPFHALLDGENYLIDRFSISYSPGAGIYSLCQRRKSAAPREALVIGVPDERAPLIADEARAVAAAVPHAQLVTGAEPGGEAFRATGAHYRLIHIATHGTFRQDNPMFSGIRLGPAYLNLYDLYHLKLDAELVALSGCATGLNVVSTGDELLGLSRGLLFAGAQSLLLTLWDVHDGSTAEFMTAFYRQLAGSANRAVALQSAVQHVRERHPHPYYWAPFTLTGKFLAQ